MNDTFPEWLARQATRNNAFGDLARDVDQDMRDGWSGFTTLGELLARMDALDACENAVATALRAGRTYARTVGGR